MLVLTRIGIAVEQIINIPFYVSTGTNISSEFRLKQRTNYFAEAINRYFTASHERKNDQ